MNEMLALLANDERILYWKERLLAHHGDTKTAIEAQLRQLVCEVGEAHEEWVLYTGSNPRKPVDFTAIQRFHKECSDIVITTLIMMAIDDDNWMHHLNQKLNHSVARMKEVDANSIEIMHEEISRRWNDRDHE